jgi:hypothetical protein
MPNGPLVVFRRFPRLRWQGRADEQIVPPAAQSEFPEFADDFAVLERELLPHFRALDGEALSRQNQFRLDQAVLIFGGLLAAVLGAIQAAAPEMPWPGAAECVVAAVLTAIAFRQRELHARERYSASRLKAEALRGEYFLFLGRLSPYDHDHEPERVRQLIRRVGQILSAQEHPRQ